MTATDTSNHFLDGQENLSELIMLLGHSNLRVRRYGGRNVAYGAAAE